MKSFTSAEYGRTIFMHLGKGDKLLESIQSELEKLDVKNAILLSTIGSLRKLSIHGIKTTEDLPTNEYINIENPIEIGAMQGFVLNGEPHFHIVCSDPEKTYVGHLENGSEVQYLAEISLIEIKDVNLIRKLDEFGIGYIDTI